jgi:hypothetical protein
MGIRKDIVGKESPKGSLDRGCITPVTAVRGGILDIFPHQQSQRKALAHGSSNRKRSARGPLAAWMSGRCVCDEDADRENGERARERLSRKEVASRKGSPLSCRAGALGASGAGLAVFRLG